MKSPSVGSHEPHVPSGRSPSGATHNPHVPPGRSPSGATHDPVEILLFQASEVFMPKRPYSQEFII